MNVNIHFLLEFQASQNSLLTTFFQKSQISEIFQVLGRAENVDIDVFQKSLLTVIFQKD